MFIGGKTELHQFCQNYNFASHEKNQLTHSDWSLSCAAFFSYLIPEQKDNGDELCLFLIDFLVLDLVNASCQNNNCLQLFVFSLQTTTFVNRKFKKEKGNVACRQKLSPMEDSGIWRFRSAKFVFSVRSDSEDDKIWTLSARTSAISVAQVRSRCTGLWVCI